MWTWLTAIGRFFGEILATVLPTLVSQWQKPREVKQVGGDPDVQTAIDDSIIGHIDAGGVRWTRANHDRPQP
jgi:hypothetical protein